MPSYKTQAIFFAGSEIIMAHHVRKEMPQWRLASAGPSQSRAMGDGSVPDEFAGFKIKGSGPKFFTVNSPREYTRGLGFLTIKYVFTYES